MASPYVQQLRSTSFYRTVDVPTSSSCALPVELEIEVLMHAVYPGLLLDSLSNIGNLGELKHRAKTGSRTRSCSTAITAHYEIVVNGRTDHFLRIAKKIRARLRLTCKRWNNIIVNIIPRWDVAHATSFPGTSVLECLSKTIPRGPTEPALVVLDHFTIDGDDLSLDEGYASALASLRLKSNDQAWVDSKSLQNILSLPSSSIQSAQSQSHSHPSGDKQDKLSNLDNPNSPTTSDDHSSATVPTRKYHSKLRVFHFDSFIAQIRPSFIRHVRNAAPHLTTLSLKGADMVLTKGTLILPRVTTLFLSFMFMDKMGSIPTSWKFPKLKHLALERDDDHDRHHDQSLNSDSTLPFVTGLIDRYRRQIVSLRLRSWRDYQDGCISLDFWNDFPRLEVLATNFLEFRPGIFLLPAPDSHPLHSLVEMTPRYGRNRLSRFGVVPGHNEGVSLKGLERVLPLIPRLESVSFTEDWLGIECKLKDGSGRAAAIARVKELCRARDIKVMDIYGQEHLK